MRREGGRPKFFRKHKEKARKGVTNEDSRPRKVKRRGVESVPWRLGVGVEGLSLALGVLLAFLGEIIAERHNRR